MKKKWLSIVGILMMCAVLALSGCSAAKNAADGGLSIPRKSAGVDFALEDSAAEAPTAEYEPEPSGAGESGVLVTASSARPDVLKIIYTVDASVVSEDCEDTLVKLADMTAKKGGYVSETSISRDDDGKIRRASMKLKIPSEALDGLQKELAGLGKVEYYEQDGQDVTSDYYDIQARLENARIQQEAYRDMLSRAETVEEALQVQAALDEIQERIEVFEGKLKLWDNLVAYSTVNVTVAPTPIVVKEREGVTLMTWLELGTGMKDGITNVAKGTVNFFGWLLIILSYLIIPLAIVAVIVILIVLLVKLGKKRRAKKKAAQAKAAPAKKTENG